MATRRNPSKEDIALDKIEVAVPGEEGAAGLDALVQQLAKEAPPFYKSRILTRLYLLMIPGCLVPSITLGSDSAMMNGLQAVTTWQECKE